MVPNMPNTNEGATTRRRKNPSSSDSLKTKSTETDQNSTDINNNNDVELKEDEFDAEITTLGSNAPDQIKDVTEKLAHDEALNKLKEIGSKTPILPSEIGTDFSYKRQVVWPNAIGFLVLHICALVGALLPLFGLVNARTLIYGFALLYGSGLGVTMGAHRLWSHRSFKAKTGLKIFLLWLHTLAGQNCLYVWVRDHRQHHKYSDTDADPHNANRGFFFSHVGWLMSRKHPKVFEYGKKIDMSDLEADKWIMFQKRHYKLLYTIFALLLPTSIPVIFWNEDPIISLFVTFFTRAVISLNATWLVNSAAHLYGTRPFDRTIFPVENMVVAFFAVGEGWHNYHHAFPWDYRASELGSPLNMTAFLIDVLAKWGWIFDRKEASHNMVKNRVMRTGDNSHKVYGTEEGRNAFKTLFNIWPHPMNPTYNSIYSPKPKIINSEGYALIPDELSKNELDEELLSKENEILEKEKLELENAHKNNGVENGNVIKKYIVDKAEVKNIIGDLSKCIETDGTEVCNCDNLNNNNNNNVSFKDLKTNISKDKSKLNIIVDEALLAKI